MKRKWAPVTETYFGKQLGELQDPDETYDPASKQNLKDGMLIKGRGAQGGGSKPVVKGNRSGSAALSNSAPKAPQKLRG